MTATQNGGSLSFQELALRIISGVLGLALFVLIWFGLAGRADWIQGWAFVSGFTLYVVALVWRMARIDPDLVRERNRPGEGAQSWDRVVMGFYTALLIALLVVAAVDGGRYRWSSVPVWGQLAGWSLLVVTGTVIWHVMGVNAYLSSWARIQEDRGQVVVTEGLYRYIRHPMYLGIIIGFLGIPLALGSFWSYIPAILIACVFVIRTFLEDRMLLQSLDGYAAYAVEVRYRLVPRIW
jgi:protein-S-isoprenylcysteine O-methyltransferase Ste14